MKPDARKEYGDIIDHPHAVDPFRPRMPRLKRAAQFSPFAALSGYEDLIGETARQTSERIELDESQKEEIDRRLNALLHMQNPPPARITFFVPDARKTGGAYQTARGVVLRFNEFSRFLTLDGGEKIPLDEVTALEADCFESY